MVSNLASSSRCLGVCGAGKYSSLATVCVGIGVKCGRSSAGVNLARSSSLKNFMASTLTVTWPLLGPQLEGPARIGVRAGYSSLLHEQTNQAGCTLGTRRPGGRNQLGQKFLTRQSF